MPRRPTTCVSGTSGSGTYAIPFVDPDTPFPYRSLPGLPYLVHAGPDCDAPGAYEWTHGTGGGVRSYGGNVSVHGTGGSVIVQAGGSEHDRGKGVASDGMGGAVVTGYFMGNATFGETTLSRDGRSLEALV